MAAICCVHRAAVIPDQWLINAVAVDIAVLDRAQLVIFQHQRITVIDEAGLGRAALVDLVEAAQRVIDQVGGLCARSGNQAIFCIIGEAHRAVAGQLAS